MNPARRGYAMMEGRRNTPIADSRSKETPVSTDETEHRTGMERRATEDDGARLRTEQQNSAQENAAQENHARGDEGTRAMRTEPDTEATYAERSAAVDGPAAAVVEERRIV